VPQEVDPIAMNGGEGRLGAGGIAGRGDGRPTPGYLGISVDDDAAGRGRFVAQHRAPANEGFNVDLVRWHDADDLVVDPSAPLAAWVRNSRDVYAGYWQIYWQMWRFLAASGGQHKGASL
jgi:hypothetical protein